MISTSLAPGSERVYIDQRDCSGTIKLRLSLLSTMLSHTVARLTPSMLGTCAQHAQRGHDLLRHYRCRGRPVFDCELVVDSELACF